MIDRLGVHAFDDAKVIDELGDVALWFAHPCAGLAVTRKLQSAWRAGKRLLAGSHRGLALGGVNGFGHLLAVTHGQVRFVIKEIHLRRPAGLEQVNHTLHLGREMRQIGQPADAVAPFGGHVARIEQRPQRHRAQPQRAALKKSAAGLLGDNFAQRVHG